MLAPPTTAPDQDYYVREYGMTREAFEALPPHEQALRMSCADTFGMAPEQRDALPPEERERHFEAALCEEEADMCEANPQRQGMTQAEGETNAALLRQEAEALRRSVRVVAQPLVVPWRPVVRRPVARRPRARVHRATRRSTAHGPPGRSTDDSDPEAERVGPPAAVTP